MNEYGNRLLPLTEKYPRAFDTYKRMNRNKCIASKIYGVIMKCKITQRYLLVKGKESGKYSFPKGHIEENETPLECIIRELYEETGIRLSSSINILSIIKPRIGTYIYCESSEEFKPEIHDTKEIGEVGWYSPEEIQTKKLNADTLKWFGVGISASPTPLHS